MYVYVCMFVCVYVCMYVCMCVYVCMYVYMYVCVCLCIYRLFQEECARLRESVPYVRPPLWSSGQSFWLQIQRSRVRSPALPDFLSSSGSGTGSTQPREPREVN